MVTRELLFLVLIGDNRKRGRALPKNESYVDVMMRKIQIYVFLSTAGRLADVRRRRKE